MRMCGFFRPKVVIYNLFVKFTTRMFTSSTSTILKSPFKVNACNRFIYFYHCQSVSCTKENVTPFLSYCECRKCKRHTLKTKAIRDERFIRKKTLKYKWHENVMQFPREERKRSLRVLKSDHKAPHMHYIRIGMNKNKINTNSSGFKQRTFRLYISIL